MASVACSRPGDQPRAEDRAALRADFDSAATRLLAGLRMDNADSVLSLMADDVVLLPPNEPALQGKAAVAAWYQQLLTQVRTASLTISDREVTIGEEYATEVSSFAWVLAPVAGGAPITERGTYMQLWHRGGGGQWLMIRELWNSSAPPALARPGEVLHRTALQRGSRRPGPASRRVRPGDQADHHRGMAVSGTQGTRPGPTEEVPFYPFFL